MSFKDFWIGGICTAFAVGLTVMFFTAYFFPIYVGWEIWWEIPLVAGLCASVWVIMVRRK